MPSINVLFSCSHVQVLEPVRHVSGRSCGNSGLHGFSVGRREQGHNQELQEEEPHLVCRRGHGHQLLPAVSLWRRHDLHLWDYIPFAL